MTQPGFSPPLATPAIWCHKEPACLLLAGSLVVGDFGWPLWHNITGIVSIMMTSLEHSTKLKTNWAVGAWPGQTDCVDLKRGTGTVASHQSVGRDILGNLGVQSQYWARPTTINKLPSGCFDFLDLRFLFAAHSQRSSELHIIIRGKIQKKIAG